jgi:hypothetical protein
VIREEPQIGFDTWASALVPHPRKAQILLEARAQGQTLELALTVLERMGLGSVEVRFLQESDPSLVLLYLDTGDMREPIYELTQAGFVRLKGINPRMGMDLGSAS